MTTLTAEHTEAHRQARCPAADEGTLALLLLRYSTSTDIAVAVARNLSTGTHLLLWLEQRGGEVAEAVQKRRQPKGHTDGVVLMLPQMEQPTDLASPRLPFQSDA